MTPHIAVIHYQLSPGHSFMRHAMCGRLWVDPKGERMTRLWDKVTCHDCKEQLEMIARTQRGNES